MDAGIQLVYAFFPSELLMESLALQLSGQLCVTKQSIAFSGTNALNHYQTHLRFISFLISAEWLLEPFRAFWGQ